MNLAVRGRRLRVLGLAGCRVSARGGAEDGVCDAILALFAHSALKRRLNVLHTLDLEHCRLLTARGADVCGSIRLISGTGAMSWAFTSFIGLQGACIC